MKINKQDLKQLIREELNALLNEGQYPLVHPTGGGGVHGGRLRSTTPMSYKAARQPSLRTGLNFNIAKELGLVPDIETGEAFGWLQRPVSTPDSEEISHPGVLRVHDDPIFGTERFLSPPADPIDQEDPAYQRDPQWEPQPGQTRPEFGMPAGGYDAASAGAEGGIYDIIQGQSIPGVGADDVVRSEIPGLGWTTVSNRDDSYKAGRSMGRTLDPVMTTDPGPSPAEVGGLVGHDLIDLNDLLDFLAGNKEGERIPSEPTD